MPRLMAFALLAIALVTSASLAQDKPASNGLETLVGAYEFDDGTLARIMLRGDSLIAESGLGPATRLKAVSADVYESVGAERLRLEFLRRDAAELRVRVVQRARAREGRRVGVPTDVLARYVGRYPLNADLAMVVTLEDQTLIAQATGASRHPLVPESASKFFVQDHQSEDVAYLEFGSGPDGPFVVFRQGGFEQKVLRK